MSATIELGSQAELDKWLAQQGDKIRVVSFATTLKKQSPMDRFFASVNTVTVTYEVR